MVLLSIKRHHILKCLSKDRDTFKVEVQQASQEQLQESLRSNNLDFDLQGLNYTLLHKLEGTNGNTKNKR